MGLKDALWKWYERHDNAINVVLEIAGGVIPGGNLVIQGVKAVHGYWKDKEENQGEEKAKEIEDKVEEVENFLESVQKPLWGLVEEIEDIPEFKQAGDLEQRKQIVQRKAAQGLSSVLSQISVSMTQSATKLKRKSSPEVINGKYELMRELGRGGEGIVYCARDLEADNLVALKKLPEALSQDPMAIESLRREYRRVVSHLVHPNIVQYRSMAQDTKDQRWFLVMDYVPGQNMRKWMLERNGESMPMESAVEMLLPIADALDYAHANKVVHCDLKPDNILIRKSDKKLMLTDFGLAKEIRSSLSKRSLQGDISGTLPYMAPEQYLGRNPDARMDVWAMGVMLYELVAGFHPFNGTSFEHFERLICHVEPERIEHISAEHWAMLQAMLLKDRTQRPQLVREAMQTMKAKPSQATSIPKASPEIPVAPLPKAEETSDSTREIETMRKQRESLEAELEHLKKQREEQEREYQRQQEEKARQARIEKEKAEEAVRLEALKKAKEEESARLAEIQRKKEESARKAKEEAEAKRKAEEARQAEVKRKKEAEEAEAKRKAEEARQAEVRRKEEAERQAEARRKKEAEEATRKKEAEEATRKKEAEEATRKKEAEEAARQVEATNRGIAVALLVLTMGIFALFRGEPSSQEKRITTEAEARRKAEAEETEARRKAKASKEKQTSAARYWISEQGVITDTTTGLEWFVGPDKETTWNRANDWVKSLNAQKFAGKTWRMPKKDELLGIYEQGKQNALDKDIHLDSIFKTTGSWVWSGELKKDDSSCAWGVYVYNGSAYWTVRGNANDSRGFVVCAGR